MAEYIERDKLFEKVLEEKRFVFQMEDLINNEIVVQTVYRDFADFVNSIPAADVVPVVHGQWICNYLDNYSCSVCGVLHNLYVGRTKFCHNCGARMDGE